MTLTTAPSIPRSKPQSPEYPGLGGAPIVYRVSEAEIALFGRWGEIGQRLRLAPLVPPPHRDPDEGKAAQDDCGPLPFGFVPMAVIPARGSLPVASVPIEPAAMAVCRCGGGRDGECKRRYSIGLISGCGSGTRRSCGCGGSRTNWCRRYAPVRVWWTRLGKRPWPPSLEAS